MVSFHSYPLRRCVGSDGVLSHLRVATILCPASRATGRPGTKRILPEYLIPRSPFWSEALVRLFERERDRYPGFTEVACEALGCVDPRTARKHIRYVHTAAKAKLPLITEMLAFASGPSEGPAFPPNIKSLLILSVLWDRFLEKEQERSGSFVALSLRPLLWLGPGLQTWRRFKRSCIPIAQPP